MGLSQGELLPRGTYDDNSFHLRNKGYPMLAGFADLLSIIFHRIRRAHHERHTPVNDSRNLVADEHVFLLRKGQKHRSKNKQRGKVGQGWGGLCWAPSIHQSIIYGFHRRLLSDMQGAEEIELESTYYLHRSTREHRGRCQLVTIQQLLQT